MAGKGTADHTVADLLRRYVTLVSPKKSPRGARWERDRFEALIRSESKLAEKPAMPSEYTPTCSRALTIGRESSLRLLMRPTSHGSPVNRLRALH